MRGRLAALMALSLLAGSAGAARAELDLLSKDTFAGVADLRVGAADGETSWLKHGFGKTRFSGDGGDLSAHGFAQGDLVWSPKLTWSFGAVVEVLAQPGQHHGVDLSQAYLVYKPLPVGGFRYRVRAGLLYPEISLEHEGYGGKPWIPRDTITPSAIGSWVGEELHPIALEGQVGHAFGDHEITVTAAAFRQSDTAGTLLATRGWSLSDYQGTAAARLPLPPLNAFLARRQPDVTRPVLELDGRAGGYAKIDWRVPSGLGLSATYFDNRGDKVSLDSGLQWAWATRFWTLGAVYDFDDKTRLTAQSMRGKAKMGFPRGRSVWVDVDFSSTYLLATRELGRDTLSGRVETFRVADNNRVAPSDYDEHGWAATAALKHPLTDRLILLAEALHVSSSRPDRVLAGLAPTLDQTVLQGSLRFSF